MEKIIYQKGQKVKVTANGCNASQFNARSFHPSGVYGDEKWRNNVYQIEGTVCLCTFDFNPKTYGAYLLTLDGNPAGYVYNDALELCEEPEEEYFYNKKDQTIRYKNSHCYNEIMFKINPVLCTLGDINIVLNALNDSLND